PRRFRCRVTAQPAQVSGARRRSPEGNLLLALTPLTAANFASPAAAPYLLDEIGEMSLYGQAKVLRVLENREVVPLGGTRAMPLDVRFIAATNQDLETLVLEGHFRRDLILPHQRLPRCQPPTASAPAVSRAPGQPRGP